MKHLFPISKFAKETDSLTQIEHLKSECLEIVERIDQGDFKGIIEEVLDMIHSGESFLYIVETKHNIDVEEKRKEVIRKNKERGYYG